MFSVSFDVSCAASNELHKSSRKISPAAMWDGAFLDAVEVCYRVWNLTDNHKTFLPKKIRQKRE